MINKNKNKIQKTVENRNSPNWLLNQTGMTQGFFFPSFSTTTKDDGKAENGHSSSEA